MDIKGIVRNVIPFAAKGKVDSAAQARSKTDANNDREGNGQASDEGQKRRQLTPEEIHEAVKYLESLSGVKDHGLTVRASTADGITVVYVEDKHGKVIRRIPESELAALTANRQKKSGHLLNKAL